MRNAQTSRVSRRGCSFPKIRGSRTKSQEALITDRATHRSKLIPAGDRLDVIAKLICSERILLLEGSEIGLEVGDQVVDTMNDLASFITLCHPISITSEGQLSDGGTVAAAK